MSNRRRLRNRPSRHELRLSPDVQAYVDQLDPADGSRRHNAYRCDTCGGTYLTVDIDPSVTPMFMRCFTTEGCDGQAVSNGYPPGPPPAELGEPVLEWYRPGSLRGLTDWERDHVQKGGLLHRPGPGAADWVRAAHQRAGA